MGLILSEPIKKVVKKKEWRKYQRKFPLKTQKITQNALTGLAHRPGEKGEKTTTKTSGPVRAFFLRNSRVFSC
jgi:hypothetical protein